MRTIGVVTVGRSDFGIYLPVLRAIRDDPMLRLHLIASGSHLLPYFGRTVDQIRRCGFSIDQTVDMLLASDTPEAIAKSMGLATVGFAQAFAQVRPDILLVLGDRFEMHAAAVAAVPSIIPLAHIHGGEVTHGALDDSLRHAITKYSHLHFVATKESARRVIQLGEEPWRVTRCGAPALDHFKSITFLPRKQLQRRLGLKLDVAPLLVTYHPVTLQYKQAETQIGDLLTALSKQRRPIIFTKSNADTNSRIINRRVAEFVSQNRHTRLVDNLGTVAYFSLMKYAAAMVGNSSSGIVEAASLQLPVVNVGIRQQGRSRSANVIDVNNDRHSIARGIAQALGPGFRESLRAVTNVYGDGQAADVICQRLRSVPLDETLIIKRFYDLPATETPASRAKTAA